MADLESFVDRQDAIFIGGGNTRSLLALWREWDLDSILRRAYRRGAVIGGVSAGMIAWFEWGVTDSIPGRADAVALPRLAARAPPARTTTAKRERRPTYHRLVGGGPIPSGVAADDGVALHFVDGALHDVVSARPTARAYLVERVDGCARETAIMPRQID